MRAVRGKIVNAVLPHLVLHGLGRTRAFTRIISRTTVAHLYTKCTSTNIMCIIITSRPSARSEGEAPQMSRACLREKYLVTQGPNNVWALDATSA
jgi:hypothetical protein